MTGMLCVFCRKSRENFISRNFKSWRNVSSRSHWIIVSKTTLLQIQVHFLSLSEQFLRCVHTFHFQKLFSDFVHTLFLSESVLKPCTHPANVRYFSFRRCSQLPMPVDSLRLKCVSFTMTLLHCLAMQCYICTVLYMVVQYNILLCSAIFL